MAEDPEALALVAACARGEASAFEALLVLHGPILRAACVRALRVSGLRPFGADLEEAEAEVRARLWRDARGFFGSFRFSCPLEAWLRLMAYRTALNWALAERRRAHEPLEAAHGVAAPAFATEAEEDLARLRLALARLEPSERSLVEGFHLEGLDYGALAMRLGLARESVGPLLSRARKKLGEFLSGGGPSG